MCGICGLIDPAGVREGALDAMLGQLVHRGPDDQGVHLKGPVGLGHRRLSIIDLSQGHQPISNEDESVWIVLNGEIYNYRGLREELIARGHRFRTHSDTEVIVHLWEEEGPACVERLRGMFAFALWDDRRQQLFAARDHLGQKPFFYTETRNGLAFASEIKALLAADPSLAELDPEALEEYLALRIVTPPRTMFRRVRKLPPAHFLTWDARAGLRISRYWDLSYGPKMGGSDEQLVDALEEQLVESLRLHMVSDVPVGAFLSGGLDSTLVVGLLERHVLDAPIDTFAGKLDYGDFDESPAARAVAERYGTRHHEQAISPSLVSLLPKLLWHLDEPSDALSVCSYLIAALARRHVKVVLGGDGGDELFGGYDRYYGNRYANLYATMPAALRRHVLGPVLDRLGHGGWYKSRAHQLRWLHQMSFLEGGDRYAASLGYFYFGEPERRALLGPAVSSAGFDPYAAIADAYDRADAEDPIDRMLYADSQLRMTDHSVMILDRMSMAHGLEARCPFLDHELAAFCARLPMRVKVRGRQLRWIQKRLAERYLPEEVLKRPKQGFASALPYMLRDEYRLLFDLFLRDSHLAQAEVLRPAQIERLLAEHESGSADHGNRLWLLLSAEVWYRMYLEGSSVADLEGQIQARAA
jgi:asparagine synthase (glutamine-hydrolysing)